MAFFDVRSFTAQISRKQKSLYPVDYEKVGPIWRPKHLFSFRFFSFSLNFSLGCKKVITIFAIAK